MRLTSWGQRLVAACGLSGPACVRGLLPVMVLAIAGGCSRELLTEYGKSKGRSGVRSLNGFGTLRRSFEANGWRTQDVHRLSDRLRSLDMIVWTPTTHLPTLRDESEAIVWLQEWLDDRPRTLIYVIPDEGSERDYWRLARDLAPPDQRLEYRRRQARALVHGMTGPLNTLPSIDRTWFRAKRRKEGSPGWEIVLGPLQYQPLVVAEDGTTLVMRINWAATASGERSAVESAADSQILVVSGGSQVTNFALTQPVGREVAQTLFAQSGMLRAQSGQSAQASAGRAGFLLSGIEGVVVSQPGDEPARNAGLELLTVWPLSLVTIHLALMGIVACLILLPIFGRPRRLKQPPQSDFADHIHAVAMLMSRTGGKAYARARISEYFRQVRGETTGKWGLPERHRGSTAEHGRPLAQQRISDQNDTLAPTPEPTTDERRI